MGLLRFLGLLYVLLSIFAGSAAVVALGILAVRFWPLMLVIVTTLAVFQMASKRLRASRP
ncbi:TPA: hypothetical protein ACNRRD_006491 [Pseudomonas aeruginosa]|uniref:Uncharacterized protein n=2 Tax=Pseudomonas aeruginosa group TaxID=136841 RepID=A0A6B1YLU9_PSEAI|nr:MULTISPECIES: hypothetical protein [Pseudomonas]ALY44370.1 hypothetical protein HW09_26515 [Pseudomonas aeruginosa]EIU2544224.1 hypothetical protein [Pseudomonas aeruginosa]EIU4340591.1 hypothetical protein [Pseudomonas aeruginosa]EIU4692724.1 hypothetical protein [Pseudomonas aeruginosa]EIU4875295.1 hypothetical protein [Pseudomonas aeruginosa]